MSGLHLQTLTSNGSGNYSYNGKSGQVNFDLTGFKDSNAQMRVAQSLDILATSANSKGGFAAIVLNSLSGRKVFYTDDISTFNKRTGQNIDNVDSSLGGLTTSGVGSDPNIVESRNQIFINPNGTPRGGTDSSYVFSSILGNTVHELLHAAGLDHQLRSATDPTVPDTTSPHSENGPYVLGSLWVDVVNNINSVLPSQIYDPVQGSGNVDYRSGSFTLNDAVYYNGTNRSYMEGNFASIQPPSAGNFLVQKFITDSTGSHFSSQEDVQVVDNGNTYASSFDIYPSDNSGRLLSGFRVIPNCHSLTH